jgi:hypothetical protein
LLLLETAGTLGRLLVPRNLEKMNRESFRAIPGLQSGDSNRKAAAEIA